MTPNTDRDERVSEQFHECPMCCYDCDCTQGNAGGLCLHCNDPLSTEVETNGERVRQAPERIWVWTEAPHQWHDTKTADSDVEYVRADLLDSQAAAKSSHELAVAWSQSTEEGSIITTADIDRLAGVIDSAATRMRGACVAKVRDAISDLSRTAIAAEQNAKEIDLLIKLREELKSLTLEGEQEK